MLGCWSTSFLVQLCIVVGILLGVLISHETYVIASTTTAPASCQEVKSPLCRIDRFSTIHPFNNSLQHRSLDEAISELHKYAYLFTKQPCSNRIQLFLCFLYAPVCVRDPQTQQVITERLMMPCRENCVDAKRACLPHLAKTLDTWPTDWDCDKFSRHEDDQLCVHDQSNSEPTAEQQDQAPTNHSSALGSSDETASGDYSSPTQQSSNNSPHSILAAGQAPTISNDDPHTQTTTLASNESICGDLFDCKQRDYKRGMRAECLDYKLVCNGISECPLEPGASLGLDELDCQNRCLPAQRYCDGRCIEPTDFCNGRADCISGEDEQECSTFTKFIYIVQYIWFIICLTVLLFSIYAFIRFLLHIKPTKHINDSLSDESIEKIYQTSTPPHPHHIQQQPQILDYKPLVTNAQFLIDTADTPTNVCSLVPKQIDQPIYHEPAYSVTTRSDYERINVGGYSGASSVYAFEDNSYPYASTAKCLNDSREPPAPPPPTPLPVQTYSTTSINKITGSYATVDTPHELGLLDQFCS